MSDLSRDKITYSLSHFKPLREALLHEDPEELEHHIQRFIEFCDSDPLVQEVLQPALSSCNIDINDWWAQLAQNEVSHGIEALRFPTDPDNELAVRYELVKEVATGKKDAWSFGLAIGVSKLKEARERFRSLVIRPLCEELSTRVADAAKIASPEMRALQAVPANRIPSEDESWIFLSHKSEDKPLVLRYHQALKELGFKPWLDVSEMPAGRNLERGLLGGFEKSCAAVFFVTENFKDEKYLATEIDYAVTEKRSKENKFAIITLVFNEAAIVPKLLKTYVFKHVSNDLEGFYEVVRGLPIELGPIRWKEQVLK